MRKSLSSGVGFKVVNSWVKFRTSFLYFYVFTSFILAWIIVNKTGLLVFDNGDLTYLNLLLSVLAELQGIILLIYTMRITERNSAKDKTEKDQILKINKKLDALMRQNSELQKQLDDIEEAIDDEDE